MPPFLKRNFSYELDESVENETAVDKRPRINDTTVMAPSHSNSTIEAEELVAAVAFNPEVEESAAAIASNPLAVEEPESSGPVLDTSLIPDDWLFAVVIPKKPPGESAPIVNSETRPPPTTRTEIIRSGSLRAPVSSTNVSKQPSELRGDFRAASPAPDAAKGKNSAVELAIIKRDDPAMFQLFWYRKIISARRNQVDKYGVSSLKEGDFDVLTRLLKDLAFFQWPEDPSEYIKKTSIVKAVKLLIDRFRFGDDIPDMAGKLINRWDSGDFTPGAITVDDDDDLLSDDSEVEIVSNRPTRTINCRGLAKELMKGVIRYRNAKGNLTMKLDPNFKKRSADIFGHNGLTIGDWWPYQLCALRDGAHGSRQGGIAGRSADGCFSVVVSGESEYNDRDSGEELFYSGTHGDAPTDSDSAAVPFVTNATKALVMSMTRGKPVRVIRRGPSEHNRLYPSCGFRYDGLYSVIGREIVRAGRGNRDFYRFRLVRNSGQTPLQAVKNRPTREEYAAYQQLTS